MQIPVVFLCKTNKTAASRFPGKTGYTFGGSCVIITISARGLCVNGPRVKQDNDVFVDCTDRRGETGPLPDGGRRLFFVAFLSMYLNFL